MQTGKEEKPDKRTRRPFDEAYKRHAVELTLQGTRSVRQIADELGVTDSMLYEWRRRWSGGVRPSLLRGRAGASRRAD